MREKEKVKVVDAAKLAEAKRRYPCSCVRLNSDLYIYDMAEQWAAGRQGLTTGLVSESLSAFIDCPMCHGSGMP